MIDSDVLHDFAQHRQADAALQRHVATRARIVASVREELDAAVAKGVPNAQRALTTALELCFPPVELDDPGELDLVADLQLRISAPSDPSRAHLGECETLTLAYREGAAVFSNDFDAARQGERLGVPVLATLDVLDLLVAANELTREVAEEAESAMRAVGRVPTDRRR